MSPEPFLEHFDLISDTPEAIPLLRKFILNLAVRGKLAESNSGSKLVADLLTRNDEARRAVAKNDRRADLERQVPLAAESRWAVPESWAWSSLADLVLFIDYRGKTPTKTNEGIRLITAKNVKQGFLNNSPEEFLSETDYHKWMTRGFPQAGDVLFTTEAPLGNAAVMRTDDKFALAQRVICFRPYCAVDSQFLALQLLAEPFQIVLDRTATGLTAKGIKAAKLKRLSVAVPPLDEQRQIVAKVDQLMTLCDQLEKELKTMLEIRQLFRHATFHHSLNGSGLS
jgi:type I restriction enzyme S subunit